ncbi:putative Superoxide dismutase (Cu-Zn) [Hypsibius exemplaris]|uniref:Superoxide dismutase (Cu-Zn) n=1 Tax=Hypsibius exemplaris TaxID=2072580 RepID=A0A1W0X7G3_HYPEX|nr:putative Superoxide dismutase (Cu-Zn) [Hypsibius exemplaris]
MASQSVVFLQGLVLIVCASLRSNAQQGYGSGAQCVSPDVGPFAVVAVLTGNSTAKGVIHIDQPAPGQPSTITGQLTRLTPNSIHGFHVHGLGDLSKGCESAGAHYNPTKQTHGDPNSGPHHIGDLGNIASDANGVINVNIVSKDVQLTGQYSVVGRMILVHLVMDDLGMGGNTASLVTGNSGARLACGVLGQLKL